MKLSKHKRPTLPQMNMTPMIDIVFLLLIFFMTVSQVSKVNKEKMQLPQQKGSDDQRTATLTINVVQQGDIVVSGKQTTLTQLLLMVGKEVERLGDPDRLTIVLRGDRRTASGPINEVVKALARMQIKRIHIAVEVSNS